MMGNSDKCVPVPSVFARQDDPKRVQRKPWTFTESEMGTTDLHNRRMTLPMGNDDDSFSVRSHEMLHAALTPYEVRPDLQGNTRFLAAEDGRIESIARSRGVTRPKGSISPDLVARQLVSGDVAGAMECGIACLGSPNESDQRDSLAALGTPEADEILSLMDWAASVYASDESVNSAYTVADKLREILGEAPKSEPEPEKGEPEKDQGEPESEDEPESEPEGDDDSESEPEPSEDEPEPDEAQGEPEGDDEPESEPDEGDDEGQGSQGDSEGDSEPEDNEGDDDSQGDGEGEPEGEPESGQGDSQGQPESGSDNGPEATHLSAMAETGHHGQGSEGPMLHGVKIPRQSAVVKTKGTGGIKRQIDKSAQEGRPKSVVPVDFDEMAKWMPMVTSEDSSWAGKWGSVEIQYPKRPVILSQKQRGHKASKATDYGSVPTRMHRLPVDSKVFKSKRHTRQGTVLVDLSGSMSLSVDEIRELIEYAPAAVIAGYAGQYGRGRIRILAADGKMVEDGQLDLTYGGNCIDGPAIAWLAQQRGPRVLVTDGLMVDADGEIIVLPIEGSAEQDELRETIPDWFKPSEMADQVIRITQKARMTIVVNPADAKKHLR